MEEAKGVLTNLLGGGSQCILLKGAWFRDVGYMEICLKSGFVVWARQYTLKHMSLFIARFMKAPGFL